MGLFQSEALLNNYYRASVSDVLEYLLPACHFTDEELQEIARKTDALISQARKSMKLENPFYGMMVKYNLLTEEGVRLMTLLEALLRIPDRHTALLLIKEKIKGVRWKQSINKGDMWLAKLSGHGLSFLEKILHAHDKKGLKKIFARGSMPLIYIVLEQMMDKFSNQFVMAETIEGAIKKSKTSSNKKYYFSYDMLGEAARTFPMAQSYYKAYDHALDALISQARRESSFENPGISIKLSALHPRYEYTKIPLMQEVLYPKLFQLAKKAKEGGLNITIDAEEADRLTLSLALIERLLSEKEFRGWNGFGMALQAYQKRAFILIEWLAALAEKNNQRIAVRLVKGAYWDSEIKQSQQGGYEDYPVFTRKSLTDISYLACARLLLSKRDVLYPQFATHNGYTVMAILQICGEQKGFEFQRLYGMGGALYELLLASDTCQVPCRIYAPIGAHAHLLPYLVRRLLENGANSSFVLKMFDPKVPIAELTQSPLITFAKMKGTQHPKIPLPPNIFAPQRRNSKGVDLSNTTHSNELSEQIEEVVLQAPWEVGSIINGVVDTQGQAQDMLSPRYYAEKLGKRYRATDEQINMAYRSAFQAAPAWRARSAVERAALLDKVADLLEKNLPQLVAYCMLEGGKILADGIDEVREAVDFCRYYAAQAQDLLGKPVHLKGYTGEINALSYEGRGVFLCISPWNFPLAIFVGQIAAALVSGNTVLAKPAENGSLIAYVTTKLFHEAGIPTEVLQLLIVEGKQLSHVLLGRQPLAGVAFTGSTQIARHINALLSQQEEIVPFIAETGGLNAMIVDSTALPEQVTDAVIRSAFQSAGQRCSALRLLYVQEDIAQEVIEMIKGAMDTLEIGNPQLLSTDVGPVISGTAKAELQKHIKAMHKVGQLLHTAPRPRDMPEGAYLMPHLFQLTKGSDLKEEAFGPILHVVTFKADALDCVIEEINSTGFGLTFGIQTRLQERVQYVRERVRAGNIYVNRDMVGAVVGVQPFGGRGLSGTGPKAGGPNYLMRFVTEKTYTDNITAAGGNTTLLNLTEESGE